MKACPFCAEQIQDAAILCRFCGRSLQPEPSHHAPALFPPTTAGVPASVQMLSSGHLAILAFVALVVVVVVLNTLNDVVVVLNTLNEPNRRRSSTTFARSPPRSVVSERAGPQLEVLSDRAYASDIGNYLYVSGQVKNLSDRPMENVIAVASWYDDRGTLMASDNAFIDFQPLRPGHTSPFKTITRGNPQMKRYTIEFKTASGRAIPTRGPGK